ncbi:MAG: hypothetical protein M5R37_02100 [Melioribacteraceae bacterium]|nr:hypothetical protein [Melioribacteraceae bacterium]
MASIPQNIISHWHYLIEGFHGSSQEFYTSLEQSIEKRGIPNLKVTRVFHKEGSTLSAKREYLRVRRYNQYFDVCAAPFGNGFFISWWLGENEGCLANIPFLGIIFRIMNPTTYFQIDTTLMFQESIRLSVLEVIDEFIKEKGLKALSDIERKPVMHDLLKK